MVGVAFICCTFVAKIKCQNDILCEFQVSTSPEMLSVVLTKYSETAYQSLSKLL